MCFLTFAPLYSKVFCDMKIEWSDKSNRVAVIALHELCMEPNTMFKIPHTLGINQMFVYQALDSYNETSSLFVTEKYLAVHVVLIGKSDQSTKE